MASNIDRVIQIIKEVFQCYQRKLADVIDGSLPDFANRMSEKSLTTVKDNFNNIMQQCMAGFPFLNTLESIEERCCKILDILIEMGEPVALAGTSLKDEISRKIHNEFPNIPRFFFQSTSSNVVQSTPKNVVSIQPSYNLQAYHNDHSRQHPTTTPAVTDDTSYIITGLEERNIVSANTSQFTSPIRPTNLASSSFTPGTKTINNSTPSPVTKDSGLVSKTHTPDSEANDQSNTLPDHDGTGAGGEPRHQPVSDNANTTYDVQPSVCYSCRKAYKDKKSHSFPSDSVTQDVFDHFKVLHIDDREERKKAESRTLCELKKRIEDKDSEIKELKKEVKALKKKVEETNDELKQERRDKESMLKECNNQLKQNISNQQDLSRQRKELEERERKIQERERQPRVELGEKQREKDQHTLQLDKENDSLEENVKQ